MANDLLNAFLNTLFSNLFNIILSALLLVLILVLIISFLWWMSRGSYPMEKLRESFFRNVGVQYRNLIGLLLGLTASLLPLTSGTWTIGSVTWVFVVALALTMVLLVAVRPAVEKQVDRFAWGLLVIIVSGYGLGALMYQAKPWWIYLWRQYLKINNTGAILLESLFLLGVILGFFVVRNWAKEQKDFVASLSAVLSGAFLSTILGKLQEGTAPAVNPLRAFAFYALGFTMSGTLNLLAAARLTANYVNKRSITSRAILDFLYGEERTKLIDGYFLKNFKADPDYAKEWLTDTLNEYRRLVTREFAGRMEQRRKEREDFRENFKKDLPQPRAKNLKNMIEKKRDNDAACVKRLKIEEELEELNYEKDSMGEHRTELQEERLQELNKEIAALEEKLKRAKVKCNDQTLEQWKILTEKLNRLKPSYFYRLITIKCEEQDKTNSRVPQVAEKEREYTITYEYLGSNKSSDEDASKTRNKQPGSFITKDMFRVGIAARWQDMLEYITAPGEYRAPFPYFGSVSGLALLFRQTIIMDRDKLKRFRNKDHMDGVCPLEIEQARGLDEIDFLSYVAIPIVSRLGSPTENGLGVVTIDTKLFVVPFRLAGEPVNASEGTFSIRLTPKQLTEFACNLYEPDDSDVAYIEEITNIIVPVVELYNKCRVGAI